jgi:hypothetical protein
MKKNKNFYDQLQDILNKTNKNDYILLSRDLNARIGNAEIYNIVRNFGQPVTNTNGLKLRSFSTYNIKIINSFHKHKNIHTYTWSAYNSKTVTDYFTADRKLSELFLDVTVYRGSGIISDHFLTLAILGFLPKWLHLPNNSACKENILHYKIRLLNDEIIRWLCKHRIQQKLQEIPESSNIVFECRNIKTIISQAADKCLQKYKAFTQNKK